MARTERYTAQEVIDALERGYTCVGAGQLLGCSAETVRNYANKYPTVKTALRAKRSELVDLAEMSLRRAIMAGEAWAVALTLKTLGKDDGYVERTQQEVTGPDGGAVRLRVEYVNDWRVASNPSSFPDANPDRDKPQG